MTSTDEIAAIHALLGRCGIPRTGSDAESKVTFGLLERAEMLADRVPASAPIAGPPRERPFWSIDYSGIGDE